MKRLCKECNNEFEAIEKEVKRGYGFFCSIECSAKYNGRNRIKPIPNVQCAQCGKSFYRNTSKKKNSKSGLYFCCRKHKDLGQRLGGFSELHPPHYGTSTGVHDYRNRAIKKYGNICNRCGYDKNIAAIVVHHKDRNRANTLIENLEVLCANCHAIEHRVI